MRTAAALGLVAVLAGCGNQSGGTLQARWTSLDTTLGSAKVRLPVAATWCPARGRLVLLAVAGDTGIGMFVRTLKLAPGLYPVQDTSRSGIPGATLALRVARASTMFALSGDSGAVAITSAAGGQLSGRFVGWFTQVGKPQPILLVGNFAGVAPAPDTVRCESTTMPPPADSVVP